MAKLTDTQKDEGNDSFVNCAAVQRIVAHVRRSCRSIGSERVNYKLAEDWKHKCCKSWPCSRVAQQPHGRNTTMNSHIQSCAAVYSNIQWHTAIYSQIQPYTTKSTPKSTPNQSHIATKSIPHLSQKHSNLHEILACCGHRFSVNVVSILHRVLNPFWYNVRSQTDFKNVRTSHAIHRKDLLLRRFGCPFQHSCW